MITTGRVGLCGSTFSFRPWPQLNGKTGKPFGTRYYHPEYVTNYKSEWEILTDIIFASAAASIDSGLTLYLHLREYTLQRKLLQEQNEKLQRHDASRSTFLTTVSHEIKNLLNAINLHARDTVELMEEVPLDLALMRENQETIEKMVVRIDRILVDLKDTVEPNMMVFVKIWREQNACFTRNMT